MNICKFGHIDDIGGQGLMENLLLNVRIMV